MKSDVDGSARYLERSGKRSHGPGLDFVRAEPGRSGARREKGGLEP